MVTTATARLWGLSDEHLAGGISADYNQEGRLAGIEMLDARKRFGAPSILRRVALEDVRRAQDKPPGAASTLWIGVRTLPPVRLACGFVI